MKATLRPCSQAMFDRQLDAMNGRGKTGNKQPPLGVGEDFVELAAHGALAGRVSLALDVGGILKQRQHALFAVFGKGVQIEELVVSGSGIDFEIAGMNDDAQRSVNGQRDAIHQAVGDPNGMDGERANLEAFAGTHFVQVGIVEQAVLVELVFHVGQRELGAPDRHVQFGENPGQSADVIFVAVSQNDAAHLLRFSIR